MNRMLMGSMIPLGWGLAGGLLASAWLQGPGRQTAVPIAILDRGHLLRSLKDSLPEADRASRIRRFESAARQLADAGYLVIDRGWVIAAPEDFYVDLDTHSP